ncbi:MAG: hypothetical protein Q9168_005198 [Polycauliona sp. 1 TL-2023]
MATRVQQDAFMDDSNDSCPLCVEEFDLSDKNFRPCPCGYQICQFCYNNIKSNMNGLCPACRRVYDEKNIEWKIISPEEKKADDVLQARKKAMARQKESERRQVESLNRKHLSGIRVVQKNLVYVVGLNPKSREEDLLQTLRGDQYFGQYGKIIKIVVSKAKVNAGGNSSIGVYVTFARREDAASCITAVDGSQNGDRTLRAQYGTTKYCSAYLRNESCNNRECMFLHEQGEDDDSFSRQDLSSINAVSTQRPAARASSTTSTAKPAQIPLQPQPPPQQAPQVVTAASHTMAQQSSRDEPMSRSDSGDGSALPSSASWAAKNAQSESRRSSKPSSMSASSPHVANTQLASGQTPSTQPPANVSSQPASQALERPATSSTGHPSQPSHTRPSHPLDRLLKKVSSPSFRFTFDRSLYSQEDLADMDATPLLFDMNGGLIRYNMDKRERERVKQEAEEQASKVLGALETTEEDGPPASGSLQLGGEPETDDGRQSVGRQSSEPRSAIQAPFASTSNGLPFGASFFGNNQTVNGRSLTPQQQQQLLMLRGTNQQSPVNTQPRHGFTGQQSQHHHQQSNPFQNQNQSFGIPGHTRHASRFTFANDTASASTAVKPNANPSLMAQQSAMMPPSQNKHFQNQAMQQPSNMHKSHFYSGVQGPPPGLKSSGTPPISGGGMFGQGHGFTQPVGGPGGLGGIGTSKNSNEQMMQNLLRSRGDTMNGPGPDVGKREFDFPTAFHNPATSNAPVPPLLNSLYGSQAGAYNGYQDHGLQKQKKKGKKHRHANTSSSGGGGIVDLADPSILQARMHHGGVGQGQPGLQGQGGYNANSMMYGGAYGDSSSPPISKPTSIPPVTQQTAQNPKSTETLPPSGPRTKQAVPLPKPTPAPVQPGLSLPQDFPPLAAPQPAPTAPPKLQKKTTAPGASAGVVDPTGPSSQSARSTAITSGKGKARDSSLVKDDQAAKPLPKETNGSVPKPRPQKEVASSETVVSAQGKKDGTSSESAAATVGPQAGSSKQPEEAGGQRQKASTKRHPGTLDLEATKPAPENVASGPTDQVAESVPASSTSTSTFSQPQTPGTGISQTSGTATGMANQARTLRVLPASIAASKVEGTRKGPAPTVSKDFVTATSAQVPSRRESLSSMNPPGTPASERISDNVSITSTSMSRANSPPLGKSGTGTARHVSKSQQKKERQARAKQAEEAAKLEEAPMKATVEEPVQAPIIGRKKKQKKTAKEGTAGTTDSTPAVTRPGSPVPDEATVVGQDETTPSTPIRDSRSDESKAVPEPEVETPISPADPASNTDQQQKNTISAAALFASLQKSGDISMAALDIFKPVIGLNHRFDMDLHSLDYVPEVGTLPKLTDAQNKQLDSGEAVCVDQPHNRRVIVLPDRRTLRGLNAEQAIRYIHLRKQALLTSEELYLLGHGPAPLRRPDDPTTANGQTVKHLPNPFLTEAQTQSATSSSAGGSKLPAAFGSFTGANPTTYVDEAAAFIATRRNATAAAAGGVVMGVEEAERNLSVSRRETEGLEKKLNALVKRNRRLIT